MTKFKEKRFGLMTDIKNGAAIGATVGGGLSTFIFKGRKKSPVKIRKIALDTAGGTVIGGIIGAALGAIASGIKTIAEKVERKKAVNYRLMPAIVGELERLGHKEGMSFTRDPRKADMLKTKVSLVIYKYSDELRVIVNSLNDQKLSEILDRVTKKISETSRGAVFKEEISGKFKDLKITAISDPSTDAGYIAWIASTFINNGYPVYLVEVG